MQAALPCAQPEVGGGSKASPWCAMVLTASCLVLCLLLFKCSSPSCQPRRAISLFSDAEHKAHAQAAQESRGRVQHTQAQAFEEVVRAQQEAAAAREEARKARAEALALRQDNAQLDKQVPREGWGRRLGSVSAMMHDVLGTGDRL